MFTGLVEDLGTVSSREGGRLVIESAVVVEDAKVGDSIAVNGCCLTMTEVGEASFAAEAVGETLSRTNLGALAVGGRVNLERPLRLSDRLGGHLVQGHVDAVGEVLDPAPDLRVRAPQELLLFVVEKGSITVDGCSLTVVGVGNDWFSVAVIPHTSEVTTLGIKGVDDLVNVEVDVMAKYAQKLLEGYTRTGRTS